MKLIKKICSWVYLIIIKFVLFLYATRILKPYTASSKIISIGNITVGGTGKTPMIIYFSKLFSKWKINHAIISRGYKRTSWGDVVVNDGQKTCVDVAQSGDEPQMLSHALKNIPIVVGNKVSAYQLQKKKFNRDVVLVDDGFQTFKLWRDLDVVLIDLSSRWKNYMLLPEGQLREPLSSLKRADVIIFTKNNLKSLDAEKIESNILGHINKIKTFVGYSNLESSLLKYKNKKLIRVSEMTIENKIVAFSGIANADSFHIILKKYFVNIQKILSFNDHHNYSENDINDVKNNLKKFNSNTIVTTLKDLVKIKKNFQDFNIYVVDIQHKIKEENKLLEYLKKKLI